MWMPIVIACTVDVLTAHIGGPAVARDVRHEVRAHVWTMKQSPLLIFECAEVKGTGQ